MRTRTRNTLKSASLFLLAADRGLEERAEDRVHAYCVSRRTSGTGMENVRA